MLNSEPLQLGGQINLNLNGVLNVVRGWDSELTQLEVDFQYNEGTPTLTPTLSNLLFLDTLNGDGGLYDGAKWLFPDLTDITLRYESINAELGDRIEDTP
jgi:hypothetical protein